MNCSRARFPSLHHSKEGWMRHKSNVAKPPLLAQTRWFSLRVSIGKPPRPRGQWTLRDIFLIARLPLLAVMQGGEFCTPAIRSQLYDCTYSRDSLHCRIILTTKASYNRRCVKGRAFGPAYVA